jgi:hypothetical protein
LTKGIHARPTLGARRMGTLKTIFKHAWKIAAVGFLFLIIDAKTGGKLKGLWNATAGRVPFLAI